MASAMEAAMAAAVATATETAVPVAAMAVMVVVAATANRATGNRAVFMARVAVAKPKGYVE